MERTSDYFNGSLTRPLRHGALLAVLLAAGCGGGGGSGGESNSAPTANPDHFSTKEDTALSRSLSATDPDGDGLTYTIVSNGAHGTVMITNPSTGAFNYTPYPNANSSDSFSFRVSDGNADSNIATVTITIDPVNDAPVIDGQSPLTTAEDTPLEIALGDLTVSDPDNAYPADFTLTVQGGANYTVAGTTITPTANYNGVLWVPVAVNDGAADSVTFDLKVTVTPVNDVPVITAHSPLDTAEDTPLPITFAALTVSDPDNAYPADFTLAVQGGANYTVAGTTVTPDADYNGTLTVPVTVNDGTDDSAPVDLEITVTPVNDAPAANADTGSVLEDDATNTVSGDVRANDTDAEDATAALTITEVGGTPTPATVTGTYGSLSLNADGSYTYALDNADPDTDALAGGEQVTDVFSYTVEDTAGATATSTLTVTVTGANDPPVADAGPDQYVTEGTTATVTLSGNGTDVDGTIAGYQWEQIDASGITVTLNNPDQPVASFPVPDVTGRKVLTFRLTVTDDGGATHQDEVNVTVSAVLLADDFGVDSTASWTVVDTPGYPSSWLENGGLFRQSNLTGDAGALNETYHLGSYAWHNDWTGSDYRFSVDITPLSATGRDVGVMFRYNDDNNYYRLSFNGKKGFARLEKKVGVTFTTLALDARGYRPGDQIQLTVDVQGNHILVYRDGDPLFSVNDASLASGTIALYTRDDVTFDNVLVEESTAAPAVVISTPVAYSVEPTNTLAVSAIAANVPSGESVTFALDGAACGSVTPSAPGVFETTCAGPIAQGDHTLSATITGTAAANDTNVKVGVLGDYYVAVGDSITNGSTDFDNYSADNQSQDGRIIAFGGYEANLDDLLTATQPYPHIIFNEGVPADTSADTFTRIASLLERHPEAETLLILLGTNDSAGATPTLSGLGVDCSVASCDGTFKGNMQALIDTITGAGKTAVVALVPPAWGATYNGTPYANPLTAARNTGYIQQYNAVIQNELTNRQLGPDLFSFFLSASVNRFSLFADNLHPNGLGTVVLAHLWHNALTGGTALPFILEDLTPSTTTGPYLKQNLLEVGDTYYVDEAFTLTSIPPALSNGRWVMTANADKANTSATYLSFSVDRPVTVYVAYDAGAGALPTWLQSGFTDTGLDVGVTDPASPALHLYQKSYSAGTVSLGGNAASGAAGTDSHYLVIVVEN